MQQTEDPWATLLVAANAGDGQAYARFLIAVTPVIRGIVRARGRSLPPDQHEDIVQDVLLGLHLKRHTWRQDHPVRPWVYAIARYKVIDAFRKRGAAIHLPIEDYSDILPAEAEADPVHRQDEAREVERLLGQLDPRSAEIVRAVSLREESQATVGARLQMSPANLRVTLHRAMKKLGTLGRREDE
ncbi:sigma-70 family RNA polymerase sigma factor [bacterium]|nr:sigma-70 family RNA polymerase sigma factor [bacterium]